MSMLIISPHNNDEGLKKIKKKPRGKKTIVKTESNSFIKNKCIPMGILLQLYNYQSIVPNIVWIPNWLAFGQSIKKKVDNLQLTSFVVSTLFARIK